MRHMIFKWKTPHKLWKVTDLPSFFTLKIYSLVPTTSSTSMKQQLPITP